MQAYDVVGYTYQADTYCPDCILRNEQLNLDCGSILRSVEQILDGNAEARGIDRYDERSFDSDQFPKVVFADSVCDSDHEFCGSCHEDLCGGRIVHFVPEGV